MIQRVVSGGQTGVDRAALDAALELGIPCGGWCPKGRLAEDAPLDARYPLAESSSADYAQRTTWNVRDSDGTLILNRGALTGGTLQTADDAARLRKPCLIVDLDLPLDIAAIENWIASYAIHTLNVAGPRESKAPGIYQAARRCLTQLFEAASSRAARRDAAP